MSDTQFEISGVIIVVPTFLRLAASIHAYRTFVYIRVVKDGLTGEGGAILYGCPPVKAIKDVNNLIIPMIADILTPADVRTELLKFLTRVDPGLLYAFDLAFWDLEAKQTSVPLYQLLGNIQRQRISITEQLWIVDDNKLEHELMPILQRGTRRLKVKVAGGSESVAYVKRISNLVGPGVQIQIDPNRDFRWPDHKTVLKDLFDLGVVAVEDPFPNWESIRHFRSMMPMPVILDAGIRTPEDLKKAIDLKCIDILNVKLSRVGGITNAMRLIDTCKEHGCKVSIGCCEDIGHAMSGILHLSSVISDLFGTEGVGKYRLGFDIAEPSPDLESGFLPVPQSNGLGCTFSERSYNDALRFHGVFANDLCSPVSFSFQGKTALRRVYGKIINIIR